MSIVKKDFSPLGNKKTFPYQSSNTETTVLLKIYCFRLSSVLIHTLFVNGDYLFQVTERVSEK